MTLRSFRSFKILKLSLLLIGLSTVGVSWAKTKATKKNVTEDVVTNLQSNGTGDFQVMFKKHAAIYQLLKDNRAFEETYEALSKSQREGGPVAVKVEPGTQTILGVAKP